MTPGAVENFRLTFLPVEVPGEGLVLAEADCLERGSAFAPGILDPMLASRSVREVELSPPP